jgi:OHCU decarboxylase
MSVAEVLNQLGDAEAKKQLEHCCASRKWVDGMMRARPFSGLEQLMQASESVAKTMELSDWLQAFAAHPRIGELDSLRAKYASTRDWAAKEQSGVSLADEQTLQALKTGNDAYFEKFGYIFIVCATGKTASQMLELLLQRLANSAADELAVAASEQMKITWLRLQKIQP